MPINIPDTFISQGTAIVEGGITQQITRLEPKSGINVSRTNDVVTLSQPDLTRQESTTLSDASGVAATKGSTADHVIFFYNWAYGDESSVTITQGRCVAWLGATGLWSRASATEFNATLLLGLATTSATSEYVVKRGLVRTDQDFSSLAIGQPLYLGADGIVTGSQPVQANSYVRMVGWAMDTDATAGLMFFSPDVNFKTVA
jgi:hypothetical protein